MRIPRSLLENVTTVTIDGQQGPSATEYDINEFGTDYSRVRVNIGSHAPNVGSLKITIY
jgi:hypothetical protein